MSHYVGASSPFKQWNYQYDFVGRLKSDGEDVFAYDTLDRLAAATLLRSDGTTVTQQYAYDPNGNQIKSQTTASNNIYPPAVKDFSFTAPAELALLAATNHLPPTAGTVSTGAIYDLMGNLTNILQPLNPTGAVPVPTSPYPLTMGYDSLGRMTASSTSNVTMGSVQERYYYNAEGLRVRTEVWIGGVLTTVRHRIYNDQRQLVSEYEAQYVAP
jgi:hypothetical protein